LPEDQIDCGEVQAEEKEEVAMASCPTTIKNLRWKKARYSAVWGRVDDSYVPISRKRAASIIESFLGHRRLPKTGRIMTLGVCNYALYEIENAGGRYRLRKSET